MKILSVRKSGIVNRGHSGWLRYSFMLAYVLVCTGMLTLSVQSGDGPPHSHSRDGTKAVKKGGFRYDQPDQTISSEKFENPRFYDADVCVTSNTVWMTWLEYQPGKGDLLWIGKRTEPGGSITSRRKLVGTPSRLANPTLTVDRSGTLWLTLERIDPEQKQWFISVRKGVRKDTNDERWIIDRSGQNDINHSVAADPENGLQVAWQSAKNGQFDVFVQYVSKSGPSRSTRTSISPASGGDWKPDIAVTEQGSTLVAWEHHDGDGFDVLYRRRVTDQWNRTSVLAGTNAFEGNVHLASGPGGNVWAVWGEGGPNWGKPFRGDPDGWNNIKDAYGPLHRFRKLQLALISPDGSPGDIEPSLPMPMLKRARNRNNARSGVELLGAYYERGIVRVDEHGRPWVFYRHFYNPQVGLKAPTKHHREQGWKCYARCLTDRGWSSLLAFPAHQRDGMQRLSASVNEERIAAAWTSGRTDRHEHSNSFNGLSVGTFQVDNRIQGNAPEATSVRNPRQQVFSTRRESEKKPETQTVEDTSYQLVFGDLHRHTDLSLCFPFYDGSIPDAFRYGIEEADLDFLGITDHTRDINQGNPRSLLWWRSIKQDMRYRIPNHFITYHSYERSRGGADHNVISLREDMLRPHTSPLPNFWQKIEDRKTFTIPHNPINPGKVWSMRPDKSYKRPLAEVYQGFRGQSSLDQIKAGLRKNHHVGVIASSDHLSTHASYACVWTPEKNRKTIYQSLINRRAYGATDRIKLAFRSGNHWMGERFQSETVPPFQIEVKGTAPVQTLVLYRNGNPVRKLTPEEGERKRTLQFTWDPKDEALDGNEHYFYVRVNQVDGNRAWSSPIWIRPVDSE